MTWLALQYATDPVLRWWSLGVTGAFSLTLIAIRASVLVRKLHDAGATQGELF